VTAVDSGPDELQLENMASAHGIEAAMFVPFAIERLAGDRQATKAILKVRLRDISGPGESERSLCLSWSAESALKLPAGVQEHTVTEWAALGVAAALIARYAGLRITAVTQRGDVFDYWVSDGQNEFGLEVSGTGATDVETRHRAKVRQWRDNPFGVDGYVVVVGFVTHEVILSFHRFEEENP
jgi:hypothetical protein